jgi:hypothetical protein
LLAHGIANGVGMTCPSGVEPMPDIALKVAVKGRHGNGGNFQMISAKSEA